MFYAFLYFKVTTAPQFVQHAGGSAPVAFGPASTATAASGHFVPVSELALGGRLMPTPASVAGGGYATTSSMTQSNISIVQPSFIQQQAGVIVQGTPQKNIVEISID